MSQQAFPLAGVSTRRSVVSLLGSAAALPLLAACAGSGASSGPGQSASGASRKPITLRWSPWDGEGQAIVEGANKGSELYKKSHPWVTIEYIGQSGDFNPKIDSMIAAGDGPEVFGGNGANWRDRAKQGQFLALDPLVKKDFKDSQVKDYVESHWKAFILPDTGQFSLPMYLGTMALYYNKNWFKERGVALPDDTWDWNKWADAMNRLKVGQDRFGAELLTISRTRALMPILSNGGHMVDPKDDLTCVIDQPASLETLQWINDRAWKDHSAIQSQEASTYGKNVTERFSTGKVASFIEGSWRLAPMVQEVNPAVEWDIAPIPKGKVKRSTRATTDGWAIYRGTKLADEAWEFMKWLQGDDWYEIMMSVVGLTPARLSQQDKWIQLITKQYPLLANRNVKVFTDAVKQRYAEPEEFFRFHKDATDIIDPAYNDSVRDNKANVATAIKEASQRVTAVQKQKAGK